MLTTEKLKWGRRLELIVSVFQCFSFSEFTFRNPVSAIRNLTFVLLLSVPQLARAATYNATTCGAADVQAALNLATGVGDIVVIPAGTCNWTSGVTRTVPANVTLMGAGTAATGGGDLTVIQDNYASGSPLLNLTVSSSGVFRMTGITVRSGTGSLKDGGTIILAGGKARIDHCHFIASASASIKMIALYGYVFGVMDHCILDFTGGNRIYAFNGRSGAGEDKGNYEWTQPTGFGGDKYFFIEDNIINGSWSGFGPYNSGIFDGFTASKMVVRFNNVSQAVLGEAHATGHGADDRGLRSQEIYGNAVTSSLAHDPNYAAVDLGNGTALVWGNSWDQVYKTIYRITVTRSSDAAYQQNATPAGWGYAGTQESGVGSNWDGGTALGTDTTLGYPCLDQPGRGQGDLLSGSLPNKVNSTTGTIYWPNQALEPVYIWKNSGSFVSGFGDVVVSNNAGGRVNENRDYYMPASGAQTSDTPPFGPFDGTVQVGWGTFARCPTTCTPGVAYFATDQGSWNTSASNPYGVQQNGADGVLYKCTAPDTWTLYYTPYAYPHPLQVTALVPAVSFRGRAARRR